MSTRLLHRYRQWRWPRCNCGQMRVAPGCRAELGGVSHGHTPCFHCDAYGNPAISDRDIAVLVVAYRIGLVLEGTDLIVQVARMAVDAIGEEFALTRLAAGDLS